jgi:hypothetical protein
VPFGEYPDGAFGGDAGGQGVLELSDGALQRGHAGVDRIGRLPRSTGGAPRRAAGGAIGLGQRAEFLGDQVGQRQTFDQIGGVLAAGRREHRPPARRAGERDR